MTRSLRRVTRVLAITVLVVLAACTSDIQRAQQRHAAGGGEETDGGLGGTGILGTVTGFGSILVNGLRVLHADDAQVGSVLGDEPVSSLETGEVVLILATRTDTDLEAERIARYLPLVGEASMIDLDRSSVRILGIDVMLSPETVIRDQAGSRVGLGTITLRTRLAVSGFWTQGTVRATHLRMVAADFPDSVTGPVMRDEQGQVRIGGVALGSDAPELSTVPAALSANGVFRDGRLYAARLRTGLASPLSAQTTTLSVEGFVEGTDEAAWISGQPDIRVETTELGLFGLFEGPVGREAVSADRATISAPATERARVSPAPARAAIAARAIGNLRDRLDESETGPGFAAGVRAAIGAAAAETGRDVPSRDSLGPNPGREGPFGGRAAAGGRAGPGDGPDGRGGPGDGPGGRGGPGDGPGGRGGPGDGPGGRGGPGDGPGGRGGPGDGPGGRGGPGDGPGGRGGPGDGPGGRGGPGDGPGGRGGPGDGPGGRGGPGDGPGGRGGPGDGPGGRGGPGDGPGGRGGPGDGPGGRGGPGRR